jgi:hypothetical protein
MFKPFKTFQSFQPPPLSSLASSRGRMKDGGFERSVAFERLERLERSIVTRPPAKE